ncbi:hypothetical protein [Natrinema sp. 1APR25-10V2]|uniref:hypothetical protein n=1 Tax=Natrinema sp. 1APR25-10V2 TaxID=2951081 RepID=UPI0028771865|nr:hypothetical protein [Natrinema sp. 1APR25-10V2]MDS0476875.1 hypothetical protein [Natrinema sp. 1APR25-10V2]
MSVDGTIEMGDADPCEEAVVSAPTAEGTIETGVDRFRFSGELTNVYLVDWNGVPAPESSSISVVHIDYGVPARADGS